MLDLRCLLQVVTVQSTNVAMTRFSVFVPGMLWRVEKRRSVLRRVITVQGKLRVVMMPPVSSLWHWRLSLGYCHDADFVATGGTRGCCYAGIILCMRPANERQRYIVTSSLIGWVHPQKVLWLCTSPVLAVMKSWHHEDSRLSACDWCFSVGCLCVSMFF